MAKQEVKIGQTDYSVFVYIPDSASTDGSGKTGLVAANLTVSYARMETDNDATITDATGSLNDLGALTTAHADWGLKEISNTLAPGLYRLDIADAVFATGAWSAVVYVMVTTSAAAASPMEFVLTPSAPVDGVNIDTIKTNPVVNAGTITFPTGATLASTTNITAGTLTTVTTATNVTTVNGLAANVITAASMNADASGEIADAVWDEDATAHQTTGTFGQAIGDPVADTTTIYSAVVTAAAGTHIAADIIAIKAETASILTDTAEIGAAGAGLTNINLPNQTMDIIGNITGNLSGSVGSVTGAVGSVTGNVGGTINGLTAVALKDFFDTDTTTTYASAVAGSVVKEIADNSGTLTASEIADEIETRTIEANVKFVNDIEVTGDGQPGTEWGPA